MPYFCAFAGEQFVNSVNYCNQSFCAYSAASAVTEKLSGFLGHKKTYNGQYGNQKPMAIETVIE
jgi:hypothetical protein